MGKTLKNLIGIDLDVIEEAFANDVKLEPIELSYTRNDGNSFILSASVSPIKKESGIASGMAIFRDITAIKKAIQELEVTSDHLVRSNKELEEFAWVAAHDLKEPVRTMGTYSKLLTSEYGDKFDEEGKQFLAYIHDASIKAMGRIDEVLRFGSIREEEMASEAVDLNEVVDLVLKDLDKAISESGAVVNVAELPTVRGRSDYLNLLLQNLLSNAIKYRGDNNLVVEIESEEKEDSWIISVKDNGIGFDEKYAEIIFRMFKRLHGDSEYPGSGLGLSLSKKIVDLHGGKIWAESRVGEGSTFSFELAKSESLD